MGAEDIITTKQISIPILNMLRIFGCNPKEKSILGTIIFWTMAITGCIFTVCSIIKCVQQTTLETFSVSYIDFLVASQTTSKGISLYLNRKRIDKILNIFWHEFWPVDKIKPLTKKHNKIYRIVFRGVLTYRVILTCCIIQISLFPLTSPERRLAYNFYYFGFEYNILLTSPYYEIMYIFECVTLSFAYIVCLIGHDMVFIAFCGCTIGQFDMLKEKFLEIGETKKNEDKSMEILKEAVKHHNLLLEFVKDLERIITFPILKQYLDAITCMGVYIYLAQQDFQFLYVFSLMTNLSQTLFFSYFGQMIQDRSSAIAEAAYDCKWHLLHSPKISQSLVLVILRAQRNIKISAGGFIFLSFESFVGMLKAAGSFLAVLRSTKE